MTGKRSTGDAPSNWRLDYFTCPPLAAGQVPPDDGLVARIAEATIDGQERAVPATRLRQYDLRGGFYGALDAARA